MIRLKYAYFSNTSQRVVFLPGVCVQDVVGNDDTIVLLIFVKISG
jgi:hypothetical protein